MGIYPDERWDKRGDSVVVHTYHVPGLTRVRVLEKVAEFEFRDNCYCCSCGERGSDPYCRNHGFAGLRPCEAHDMPGQTDEDDVMPVSVQVARSDRPS
jgi:hypothetical protein